MTIKSCISLTEITPNNFGQVLMLRKNVLLPIDQNDHNTTPIRNDHQQRQAENEKQKMLSADYTDYSRFVLVNDIPVGVVIASKETNPYGNTPHPLRTNSTATNAATPPSNNNNSIVEIKSIYIINEYKSLELELKLVSHVLEMAKSKNITSVMMSFKNTDNEEENNQELMDLLSDSLKSLSLVSFETEGVDNAGNTVWKLTL